MNLLKTIILISAITLVSCSEKTIENSKYKNYIETLNASMSLTDSVYNEFAKINHDSLAQVQENGVLRYKTLRKVAKMDTLDLFYEANMNIYKSIYVKSLNNIADKKASLEHEYEYSKSQINDLIPLLIKEHYEEDSAAIYFNSEKEGLFILEKELINYNSLAHQAFSLKDSLDNNLDSLMRKYDKTNE